MFSENTFFELIPPMWRFLDEKKDISEKREVPVDYTAPSGAKEWQGPLQRMLRLPNIEAVKLKETISKIHLMDDFNDVDEESVLDHWLNALEWNWYGIALPVDEADRIAKKQEALFWIVDLNQRRGTFDSFRFVVYYLLGWTYQLSRRYERVFRFNDPSCEFLARNYKLEIVGISGTSFILPLAYREYFLAGKEFDVTDTYLNANDGHYVVVDNTIGVDGLMYVDVDVILAPPTLVDGHDGYAIAINVKNGTYKTYYDLNHYFLDDTNYGAGIVKFIIDAGADSPSVKATKLEIFAKIFSDWTPYGFSFSSIWLSDTTLIDEDFSTLDNWRIHAGVFTVAANELVTSSIP